MPKIFLNFWIKNKVRYFNFLFEKGFEIRRCSNFLESLGNWFIEFESDSCFIVVLSDRDEIIIRIYPVKLDRKIVIGLKPMIYYLTNGKTFIGTHKRNLVGGTKKQVEQMSELLEKYIDRIIPYFGNEFQTHKDGKMVAQKRYIELQVATYES